MNAADAPADRTWPSLVVIAILALLVSIATTLLLWRAGLPGQHDLALAALFGCFMALAWRCPLPLTDKTKLYLDTTATLGAVLYFMPAAPGVALALAGAGALLGQSARGQPADEVAFNSAQVMLQAAVGCGVLALAGWDGPGALTRTPSQLQAVAAAGVAILAVNLLAVSAIIALQTATPPRQIVARTVRSFSAVELAAHAVQLSLGVVAAALATTATWAVGLLLAPSAGVYWVLAHNRGLRRRLEALLREREVRLAETERLARLGSWDWQLETGELVWSEGLYDILGVARDVQPTIRTFVQLAHPDDRDLVNDAVDDLLRGGAALSLEHRVVLPDGRQRVVHAQASVLRDAAGDPARLRGIVHDITDRKALEAQLFPDVVASPLTSREEEVLVYLARGNSNKEIATLLGISEQTVKNHMSSIFRKLRVSDRTQAVVYAVRRGWVRLDDNDDVAEAPARS